MNADQHYQRLNLQTIRGSVFTELICRLPRGLSAVASPNLITFYCEGLDDPSPADGPKPQRPPHLCRARSRSSGVMRSHRSAMRRRKLGRGPRKPWLPKSIRHSARIPTACQKVSCRQPKSDGSSQFHKCITISPPTKIKSAMPTIAAGTIQNNFRFPLVIFNYLMLSKIMAS